MGRLSSCFAVAVAVALAFGGCGGGGSGEPPDAGPPPEVCTGGYHVCRGHLRDADGRALVLRGVNLSGRQKAPPYIDVFTAADYAALRTQWGMTGIRFILTWSAVEPTDGGFDTAYLDELATRVQWAADAGLGVILDMHQDVYGEGFGFDGAPGWTCDQARYDAFVPQASWALNYADPNVMACFDDLFTVRRDRMVAAWRRIAERLADAPAVIGFDPINEPNWGTYAVGRFERDRLEPYYDAVVAAVREVAPGWVAFLEPAGSRNLGVPTGLVPFAYRDVVYAPHLYDLEAEANGMFDPAHRDALIGDAANLRNEATQLGAALWIGEYGGLQSDPNVTGYLDAAYDGAAGAWAGTMTWAYDRGTGYALLDPDGNEVPVLVDAIVRPYPARIAGEPVSWSYDDAARELEVAWQPDPAITAPTVIIAPARVYPDGVTVDCGGCTVDIVGDEVRLGPGGATTTAVVRPAL